MSNWATVRDSDRNVHIVEDEGLGEYEHGKTDEARLYELREGYHKALSAANASVEVGDKQWEDSKESMLSLTTELDSLISSNSSDIMSQSPANAAAGESGSSSKLSFINNCKHISYLTMKNLSRMFSKESRDKSQEDALSTALIACNSMNDLGIFDPGLVFRTAMLATNHGDQWTCGQLLSLNYSLLGDLYREAAINMIKGVDYGKSNDMHYQNCHNIFVDEGDRIVNDVFTISTSNEMELGEVKKKGISSQTGIGFIIQFLSKSALFKDKNDSLNKRIFGELKNLNVASGEKSVQVQNDQEVDQEVESIKNAKSKEMTEQSDTNDDVIAESKVSTSKFVVEEKDGERKSSRRKTRHNYKLTSSIGHSQINHNTTNDEINDKVDDKEFWCSCDKIVSKCEEERQPNLTLEDLILKYREENSFIRAFEAAQQQLDNSKEEYFDPLYITSMKNYAQLAENELDNIFVTMCDRMDDTSESEIYIFFISLMSKIVYLQYSDKALFEDLVKQSGGEISIAVLKAWYHLTRIHSFRINDILKKLNEDELLFIGECSIDIIKLYDSHVSDKDSDVYLLYKVANETISSIFSIISANTHNWHEDTDSNVCMLQYARRLWLGLMYWSCAKFVEDDTIDLDFSDVFEELKKIFSKIESLSLPHLHHWNLIDKQHVNLFEGVLQENDVFKDLIEKQDNTNDWLQSALASIEANTVLISIVTTCVNRKTATDYCLPILILRTCSILNQYNDWFILINRVAFTAAFALLNENLEEVDGVLSWFTDFTGVAWENMPSVDTAFEEKLFKDAILSFCYLIIISYQQNHCQLYKNSYRIAVKLCEIYKDNTMLGPIIETFFVCARELQNKKSTKANTGICKDTGFFCLSLLKADSFSKNVLNGENMLVESIKLASLLRENRDDDIPVLLYSSSCMAMYCVLALPNVNSVEKLEMLIEWHTNCSDNNLYTVDDGKTLLYFSTKLRNVISPVEVDKVDKFIDLKGMSSGQQTHFAATMCEFYYILYSFPLGEFTYGDGQECTLFGLSINDPIIIESLYSFYKFGAGFGVGSKSDRRSSLFQLTNSEILINSPLDTESYGSVSTFLFGNQNYFTISEVHSFIDFLNFQNGNEQAANDFTKNVLSSVYFERFRYAADHNGTKGEKDQRELNSVENIAPNVSSSERRLLHIIDLCVKDLAYSPLRHETWATLHTQILEYLFIILDELGEICIPSLLSDDVHSELIPCNTSLDDFMDGKLRLDNASSIEMQNNFVSEIYGGLNQLDQLRNMFCTRPQTKDKDAPSLSHLCALIGIKNVLKRCLVRTSSILDKIYESSIDTDKDKENAKSQLFLNHGNAMLTLSTEFTEGSLKHRECLMKALNCYEKINSENVFVISKSAHLKWYLFNRIDEALACLDKLANIIHRSSGSTKAQKNNAKIDATVTIFDIAYTALVKDDCLYIDRLNILYELSKFGKEISEVHNGVDLIWATIINCVISFKECRKIGNVDSNFISVYGLAVLLRKLSTLSSGAPPAWVTVELKKLDVEISSKCAFDELHKLFGKKLQQIVGIWSQEKALHEWDILSQRTYNFDNLRREYVGFYLRLAEECGEFDNAVDVLRDCLASKRQTASVYWMLDKATKCITNIAEATQIEGNRQHFLLTLYDVFQIVVDKANQNTVYKLQQVLCSMFSVYIGKPIIEVNIGRVLKYFFKRIGKQSHQKIRATSRKRKRPIEASVNKKKVETDGTIIESVLKDIVENIVNK